MLCISIIVILVIFKKYVLHGSVATQLKCGMIFNNYFITNCPKNEPMKNPLIFDEILDSNTVGRFCNTV